MFSLKSYSESDKMSQNLVKQSNRIIAAHYSLDLVEQRLILQAASKINLSQKKGELIEISAIEYAKQFNTKENTSYEALQRASEKLFNRYVSFSDIDPADQKERVFKLRWVDKIGYKKDLGILYLRFTSEIELFLTELKSEYTKYELENVSKVKSVFAIRIYQLAMQWQNIGHTPVYSIEEFRKILGIEENSYKNMSDLKKYVLDFGVQQINKFTDLDFYNPDPPRYDPKTGKARKQQPYKQIIKGKRTIVGFQFFFRKKKAGKTINSECKDITPKSPQTQSGHDPDIFDGLTENEKSVIKSAADKHIKDKNITDPAHKENIYKKAVGERWSLTEHDKQTDDFDIQNKKVAEQIVQDQQKAAAERREREQQQQVNQDFVAHFESLDPIEQTRILDEVQSIVARIPVIGDSFKKSRAENAAHKDISFRTHFKKVMGISQN